MSQTIILFINIISVTLYTFIWGFCGYILSVTILGYAIDKKRLFLHCGLLIVTQLISNYFLVYVILAEGSTITFNQDLWDLGFLVVNAILLFSILSRRYKDNPWRTITAVALSQFMVRSIYYIIGETIEYLMQRLFPEFNIAISLTSSTLPYLFLFICTTGAYHILRKTKFSHYFYYLFHNKAQGILSACISTLLVVSFFFIRTLQQKDSNGFSLHIPYVLLMLFALIVFQAIAMRQADKERLIMQQETIAQQKAYLAVLEDFHMEMRTFRHDFQNILTGMALQADEGNLKQIKEFLSSTVGYMDDKLLKEIRQMGQLSMLQSNGLKSLLTIKLGAAKAKRVAVSAYIPHTLYPISLREEDLLRCLGILLDNAIEEAEKHIDAKISIAIIQEEKELVISVSNTCPEKPDLSKMVTSGFSTKGKHRGAGLVSYHRIISNYPCCTSRTIWQEGVLIQQMHIYRTQVSLNQNAEVSI